MKKILTSKNVNKMLTNYVDQMHGMYKMNDIIIFFLQRFQFITENIHNDGKVMPLVKYVEAYYDC